MRGTWQVMNSRMVMSFSFPCLTGSTRRWTKTDANLTVKGGLGGHDGSAGENGTVTGKSCPKRLYGTFCEMFFFKILRDPDADEMEIPKRLVKYYLGGDEGCDRKYELLTEEGYKYDATIKKIKGVYYFEDGWRIVVNELPIHKAFFVLFNYLGGKQFNMTFFNADGTNIDLRNHSDSPDMPGTSQHPNNMSPIPMDLPEQDFTVTATRFRLPIALSTLAKVEPSANLEFKNFDGSVSTMTVRQEKSRKNRPDRFAVKEWNTYMETNGIHSGQKCKIFFKEEESMFYVRKI